MSPTRGKATSAPARRGSYVAAPPIASTSAQERPGNTTTGRLAELAERINRTEPGVLSMDLRRLGEHGSPYSLYG